jgi:hypothetical protein
MADIRSLDAARKQARKEKAKATTLCRHGHHRWEVDTRLQFDVKAGKLVTRYQCARCGKYKNKAE